MEKVNLAEKLELISESWRPRVVGELNGQEVKLVRFNATFVWHHHDHEDELFLGVRGRCRVAFGERAVEVGPGEFIIVPRGVEHRTAADDEAEVLLYPKLEALADVVYVLAVGKKERNVLRIAGEVIKI